MGKQVFYVKKETNNASIFQLSVSPEHTYNQNKKKLFIIKFIYFPNFFIIFFSSC